jgi:hypothetical protein
MTEFEMISAMQGYANINLTIMMNFFTVLTAYLAAGYLAAHRLSRAMAIFVTAMYLVMSTMFLVGMYRIMAIQAGLLHEMVNFAKAGKGLAWAPFASTNTVESVNLIIGFSMFAIVVSAIVGGVYFFYDCRKRNPIGSP